VPVTPPTEAKLEPDWDECLAVMLKKQPSIVRMQAMVKEAQGNADGDGLARLERREAVLKQVIHDSTHSLARFFLEIDANFKQFKTASRLRAATARRLESQRAYYDEGRITIDRFLDAISQYAIVVATEAQYRTTYNNAIVALEEAKGTLLDRDGITVVEGPKSAVSIALLPDFTINGDSHDPPVLPERTTQKGLWPISAAAIAPKSRMTTSELDVKGANPNSGGKTYSFQFKVGSGPKPFEFGGSFTITPVQSGQMEKPTGGIK
jgi:hypothetical protein